MRSIACRSGLNPSETDLEVAAAGVIKKENVESYDRDINFTLFKYYLGLGFRGSLSTAIYYGLNLLTDGRLSAQVSSILNNIGIYIR
ncbi:MAG: hypothetical protein N3D75_03775 [Candidatus Aenigmarchaeota archaeon]|nr:hypothetical protein [Candidatus Aenigmarchaeota archaeon]